MSEEKAKPSYLEKLAKLDVGGNYVPSADGLITTFKLFDPDIEALEVEKTYEGRKNIKYQWQVIVSGLAFHKAAYRDILTDSEEGVKKLNRIDDYEKGVAAIMELSKTATKQLAIFILENDITKDSIIKYLRLGTGNKTEYQFKLAGKKTDK